MKIEVDYSKELLIIEGVQYSFGVFRHLGFGPSHPDELMKIVKRESGMVTVATVRNADLRSRFDALLTGGL